MSSVNVVKITDANFEQEVMTSKLPFMLDFGADYCQPCKIIEPLVEKLADEQVGKIRVGKVDITEAPLVARKFGIRNIPVVVMIREGKETGRMAGAPGNAKQKLAELLGA